MRTGWLAGALLLSACARGDDREEPQPAPPFTVDGSTDAVGFADGCGIVEVAFVKQHPTVVLLVDQSLSMGDPLEASSSKSKWQLVREALTGPEGIVPRFAGEVRFGATFFRSDGGFAGPECPILTSTTIGAAAEIDAVFREQLPRGDTPTGDSIRETRLRIGSEPRPLYLALVTDGEPDTCAMANPQNGQQEAILATQIAFTLGIRTFVISVGSQIAEADLHLQELANAGAGLPVAGTTRAKTYQALDAAALRAAFQAIVDGVRACAFALDGKVKDPARGTVTLDGEELPLDGADGYRIEGGNVLTLTGEACTAVQTGEHRLRVLFPCDAFLR